MHTPDTTPPDRTIRLLELGTCAVVLLAPLPFGSVSPAARLALELAALALLLVWALRSAFRPTALPALSMCLGLVFLLLLSLLQIAPLGRDIVSILSPGAVRIRTDSLPAAAERAAETHLLGDPGEELGPPVTLSVEPGATASALRTGAALCALLLVATTVSAVCGVRRLALALLLSAAFQGLYGMLVLASGHDRIWSVPKQYFLDSATGTFVNRNHFACFLAMCLSAGAALIHERARETSGNRGFLSWFAGDRPRYLLLGLPLVAALAGLMLSFSRAGIALGLFGLGLTMVGVGRLRRLGLRLAVTLLVVAAATVPLIQIGAERLVARYASSTQEIRGTRAQVWRDTLALFAEFPATGSGFGTFASAYPLVRAPRVRAFFAHAHSDPLQVLAEGGALGLGLFLLLIVPLLRRIARSLGGAKGALGVGLAAGLTAFLLHGLVDFNGHIPANAATAAILVGALEGLPWTDRASG